MTTTVVSTESFSTFDVTHEPRRDSRDWRNVASPTKRKRKGPRRQNTRQAVLQAYAREGGLR